MLGKIEKLSFKVLLCSFLLISPFKELFAEISLTLQASESVHSKVYAYYVAKRDEGVGALFCNHIDQIPDWNSNTRLKITSVDFGQEVSKVKIKEQFGFCQFELRRVLFVIKNRKTNLHRERNENGKNWKMLKVMKRTDDDIKDSLAFSLKYVDKNFSDGLPDISNDISLKCQWGTLSRKGDLLLDCPTTITPVVLTDQSLSIFLEIDPALPVID